MLMSRSVTSSSALNWCRRNPRFVCIWRRFKLRYDDGKTARCCAKLAEFKSLRCAATPPISVNYPADTFFPSSCNPWALQQVPWQVQDCLLRALTCNFCRFRAEGKEKVATESSQFLQWLSCPSHWQDKTQLNNKAGCQSNSLSLILFSRNLKGESVPHNIFPRFNLREYNMYEIIIN